MSVLRPADAPDLLERQNLPAEATVQLLKPTINVWSEAKTGCVESAQAGGPGFTTQHVWILSHAVINHVASTLPFTLRACSLCAFWKCRCRMGDKTLQITIHTQKHMTHTAAARANRMCWWYKATDNNGFSFFDALGASQRRLGSMPHDAALSKASQTTTSETQQ